MLKRLSVSALALVGAGAVALPALAAQPVEHNYPGFLYDGLHAVTANVVTGTDFSAELARSYGDLALFEAENQYDFTDGEHFGEKAEAAQKGGVPLPEMPADWDIDRPAVVAELTRARDAMMDLFVKGAPESFPALSAKAQVTYDCWVEQEEEGFQAAHIAACRKDHQEAMDALRAALMPGERIVAEGTVYFDFDQSAIRPDGQQAIDKLAASLDDKDRVTMRVTGYADRSGPADYNMTLSRKRAEAVRRDLEAEGLRTEKDVRLSLTAEGEADPAVPTPDGVREPLNRRVVIQAVADKDAPGVPTVTEQQAMATTLW